MALNPDQQTIDLYQERPTIKNGNLLFIGVRSLLESYSTPTAEESRGLSNEIRDLAVETVLASEIGRSTLLSGQLYPPQELAKRVETDGARSIMLAARAELLVEEQCRLRQELRDLYIRHYADQAVRIRALPGADRPIVVGLRSRDIVEGKFSAEPDSLIKYPLAPHLQVRVPAKYLGSRQALVYPFTTPHNPANFELTPNVQITLLD